MEKHAYSLAILLCTILDPHHAAATLSPREGFDPMSDTAKSVPPARNLAIFLDGTTDIATGNTNVWRLKSLCDAAPDSGQLVFYGAGVGTSFGEKLRGGVFGYGIDDVVAQAYLWLMENYRDNDNIFIFGFSRGAYTARSLAGLISRCGVIKLGAPISIQQLYARYQQGNHVRTVHQLCEPGVDPAACSQEERWMMRYCRAADILFTGVWDTVGAVATDDKFAFITGGDHTFLDVNLRQTEKNVYHAVAIDENRLVFDVNLLTQYVPGTDAAAPWMSPRLLDQVEQRWFAGSHGNVGGGSYNDLLAQLPLRWLMSKAQAHGLKFRFPLDVDVDDGAGMGAIDDSFKAFLNGTYALLQLEQRHWRPIDRAPERHPTTMAHTVNETIDGSVFDRWRNDEKYRPQNLAQWAARHGVDPGALHGSCLAGEPGTSVPA